MSKLSREQALIALRALDEETRFGVETGRRLLDLADLLGDGHTVSLDKAVASLFQGLDEKQALAAFRKWRADLKRDFKKRGSDLEIKVDTRKRAELSERVCWFEGEPVASASLEALSMFSEAAATDKPLREQVQPRGREIDPENPEALDESWGFCVLYPKSMEDEAKPLCNLIDGWFRTGFSRVGGPIAVGEVLTEGDKYVVERSELCFVLIGRDDMAEACAKLPAMPGVVPVRLGRAKSDVWADVLLFDLKGKAFNDLRDKAKRDEFVESLHTMVERKCKTLPRKPQEPALDKCCDLQSVDQRPDLPLHAQRTRGKEIDLKHADHSHDKREGIPLINAMQTWAADPSAPVFGALLGEYGMGKTTTCRMLTHDLNNRRRVLAEQPPVIYLDLRELQASARENLNCEKLIDKVLEHSWTDTESPRPTAKQVIKAVREDRAVVIFDGLDEVLNLLTEVEGQAFTRELWRILPPGYEAHSPQLGVGKILISCRTHFFKTLDDARNHLLGEQRANLQAKDYCAWLVLPFDAEQIKSYLAAALPERDPQDLLDLFAKIHNLNDLATRPYTLELVSAQIESLERKIAAGEGINTADLYDGFIEQWLHRDTGKHQLRPEHKRQLMQKLAAEMWRDETRSWDGERLEDAMLDFLDAHPRIERHYRNKDLDLLKEDLRNATFVVWKGSGGFRFAHTSMQEFFLADYLVTALADEEQATQAWAIRQPSVETLDFVADRLASDTTVRTGLQLLLRRFTPEATLNALSYARRAITQRHWSPSLEGLQLRDVSVPYLHLKGSTQQLFNLRKADFENCHFNHLDWSRVDFRGARIHNCTLSQAVVASCNISDSLGLDSHFFGQWHNNTGDIEGLQRSSSDNQGELAVATKALGSRMGHSGPLSACAFDTSGQRIVSASHDNTLRLWDVASGEYLRVLEGHQEPVTCCGFDPSGQRIVSASYDSTLRLWAAATGECLRVFEGHQGLVTSCSFDPSGQRIVSTSWDNTLRLWDATSGECLRVFDGHQGPVTSCGFDPNGQHIVSASHDNTLRLWDTATGECLRILKDHQDPVTDCGFDPSGQRIVSASYDNTLRFWDATSGECLRIFEGHQGRVTSCGFDRIGQRIISASHDNTLRLWNTATGECLRIFERQHQDPVMSCSFDHSGQRIVSASWDNTLRLWDATSGECLRVFEGHQGSVTSCGFDPRGQCIVSASYDNTLQLWDTATGECLRILKGHQDPVTDCGFDPSGQRIVSASYDKTLRLWDTATGECLRVFEGNQEPVTSCSFDPSGQHIVTTSWDNTLQLWDATSGECLRILKGHQDPVTGCGFDPSGQRIVSASYDKTLRLWDVASGECLRVFKGQQDPEANCSFDPTGQRIVSASYNNTLRLWDTATGECLRVFEGHQQLVSSFDFDPSGQHIVSASHDNTLRLWDTATGECLRVFEGHHAAVSGCSFDATGNRINSASRDGTLRLSDADSGECLQVTYAALPQGYATLRGNELIAAAGPVWRYLAWYAPDENGTVMPYALETGLNDEQRSWLSYE